MPSEYGQPIDTDDEARKKKAAENPLVQYFGGGQGKQPAQAPQAPATPQAPAAPTAPSTNVGAGAANTGNGAQPRSAGGFTNFGRVIAANKDVSTREAKAYEDRATQNATKARTSLDALRARFGDQLAAGTVAGPDSMAPPQDGLMHIDPMSGLPLTGHEGTSSDAMLSNAEKTYSGPGGLGDIEGVEDTYADTLAAEQNLGALGSQDGLQALIQQQTNRGNAGTSRLSGALIGSAGRRGFDALRARFDPEADMESAETLAGMKAKTAGDISRQNAGDWRALGGRTRTMEEGKAADDAKRKTDAASADAARKADAELDAKFEQAMQHDLDDLMNSNFESFNTVMNPITQIAGQTGNRDFIQDYGTNLLTPQSGSQSGGGSRKIWWKPEHKAVYKQMDDAQWAELKKLPQSAQARWLDTRKDEIASGQPHAPFDAGKDYGKNAFYGWKL